jgi:manganese transport protein
VRFGGREHHLGRQLARGAGEDRAMSTQTGAVSLTPVQELRRRGRLRGSLPFIGPAFVAAIAYVDPGNFATNIAGGSQFGYLLLWVILAANLVAMLIQNLSAKVGTATGRNLPELCREHFPRPVAPSPGRAHARRGLRSSGRPSWKGPDS